MLWTSFAILSGSDYLLGDSTTIDLRGSPGPIVASDFNGDGNVDFAVGDQSREAVVILLGTGSGAFIEPMASPHSIFSSPEDLAAADINADGFMDIAIANHDTPTLSVLLGDGEGDFREPPNLRIRVNSRPHPHGIAVGDFDLDGTMDLATESWEDDEILVLYGSEPLAFPQPHYRQKVGDFPYFKLRSEDLNGDKRIDLFTANWGDSSLAVMLADRQRGFHPTIFVPTPKSPFAVASGDLNHDGHQDIAAVHRLGNSRDRSADGVSINLGNGSGSFSLYRGILPDVGISPTSLAIGDFDGDGFKDIAVANYGSNDVSVILSKQDRYVAAPASPYSVGKAPVTVLLEDVNNDGLDDIVTTNSEDNSLSIIHGQG